MVIYSLIFMCAIAVFGIFGSVFQASGGMVVSACVVGVVVMMVTASSYRLLVQAYPEAGSVFAYAAPPAFLPFWGSAMSSVGS